MMGLGTCLVRAVNTVHKDVDNLTLSTPDIYYYLNIQSPLCSSFNVRRESGTE